MNHESMRQLLALQLYDELDRSERERLARHLDECGDCRVFDELLRAGLGALKAGPADEIEWLPGRRQALRRATNLAPARARPSLQRSLWCSAAAGFAACGLILWALGWAPARQERRPGNASGTAAHPSLAKFSRATTPPRAQSSGGLGQWLGLQRR